MALGHPSHPIDRRSRLAILVACISFSLVITLTFFFLLTTCTKCFTNTCDGCYTIYHKNSQTNALLCAWCGTESNSSGICYDSNHPQYYFHDLQQAQRLCPSMLNNTVADRFQCAGPSVDVIGAGSDGLDAFNSCQTAALPFWLTGSTHHPVASNACIIEPVLKFASLFGSSRVGLRTTDANVSGLWTVSNR